MYEQFYNSFRKVLKQKIGDTYKLQGRGDYRLKWIGSDGEIIDCFEDFDDLVSHWSECSPEIKELFDEHTGLKKLEEEYYGEYQPHEYNFGFKDYWELTYGLSY
jgi:hypothetical protein